MKNDCMNCEKEAILNYADMSIELDKSKKYCEILENCLDTKEELCKVLREENEILRNKLNLYTSGH